MDEAGLKDGHPHSPDWPPRPRRIAIAAVEVLGEDLQSNPVEQEEAAASSSLQDDQSRRARTLRTSLR